MGKLDAVFRYFFNNLTRITSGGSFIPEIDGLRFIAIFPVVLHHLLGIYLLVSKRVAVGDGVWAAVSGQNWMVHLISHGNYGVQIFFVISGFILALPFARQHFGIGKAPAMKAYFLRRVSRLEPTYLINLAVIFSVYSFIYKLPALTMTPHLLATMSYLHNQIYAAVSTISDVTWSLEVEVQFYVLAPVLALVFKVPHMNLRRLLIMSVVIVWPALSVFDHPRIALSLINYIQYFACGFMLADIYLLDWKEKPVKTLTGDLIAIAGAAMLICSLFELLNVRNFLPSSILLFFVGVFTGKTCNYIFTRKVLVIIGGMCYTIYLYHNLIINYTLPRLVKVMPGSDSGSDLLLSFIPITVVVLVILLTVCSVLFVLFERPFMKKEWYRFKRKAVMPLAEPILSPE